MRPQSRPAAGVLLIAVPTGRAMRSECGFPENSRPHRGPLTAGH